MDQKKLDIAMTMAREITEREFVGVVNERITKHVLEFIDSNLEETWKKARQVVLPKPQQQLLFYTIFKASVEKKILELAFEISEEIKDLR